MRFQYFFIVFMGLLSAPAALLAQESPSDSMEQIIALRAQLKKAIKANDTRQGAVLTDAITMHSSCSWWGLMWDERWMAYHWTGRYQVMLKELEQYTEMSRMIEDYCEKPPADSLFELLDDLNYREYERCSEAIANERLPEEARELLSLHLHYLLRDNSEKEKERRRAFLDRYPRSKYEEFVKTFMELPPKLKKHYFSWDVLIHQANWTGNLNLALRPGWGFQTYLNYHRKALHLYAGYEGAWAKVNRDIYHGGEWYPKGEIMEMQQYNVGAGVNLLDVKQFRLTVGVEGGRSRLLALSDSLAVIDPRTVFRFASWHRGAYITGDLKIKPKTHYNKGLARPPYNGVRIRAGFRQLFLENDDDSVRGNMFYIGMGYQFSGGKA